MHYHTTWMFGEWTCQQFKSLKTKNGIWKAQLWGWSSMRYNHYCHYAHREGVLHVKYRVLIVCAPLRLQSREMQPRGCKDIQYVQTYIFKHIDGELWVTDPHPNICGLMPLMSPNAMFGPRLKCYQAQIFAIFLFLSFPFSL